MLIVNGEETSIFLDFDLLAKNPLPDDGTLIFEFVIKMGDFYSKTEEVTVKLTLPTFMFETADGSRTDHMELSEGVDYQWNGSAFCNKNGVEFKLVSVCPNILSNNILEFEVLENDVVQFVEGGDYDPHIYTL